MADIFRLLSRSTSFAKGASGGSNVQQTRIPVTAPTAAPKKRKPANDADAVPKELDFFSMGAAAAAAESAKKRKHSAAAAEEDGNSSDSDEELPDADAADAADASDLAGPVLSTDDEIRKLLWTHKLKFTTLTPHPTTTTGEKKKKKKKQQPTLLIPPLTSFAQLRSQAHGYALSKRLYGNILAQGYTTPTPVQMGALPALMRKGAGVGDDMDLLVCAPTGSGKTLAYVVPLLDWILRDRAGGGGGEDRCVKAVVLAPTKELVGQIVNEVRKLAVGTGVKVAQMKKGMVGVRSEVLVSTPLMLLHAIEEEEEGGKGVWVGVRRLVLDEADVLLDELFKEQTLGIWRALKERAGGELRTSLWSATISSSTEEIAQSMIHPGAAPTATTLDEPTASPSTSPSTTKSKKPKSTDPSSSSSSSSTPATTPTILRLIIGLKNTTLPTISQTLLYTSTEPGKLLALRQHLTTSLHPPALIFVQSIPRATALHSELLYDLPSPARIAVLHASLTDTAREDTMARFRSGEIWILITTDVLARGVDFKGVRLVVNYDIPTSVGAYIHRVGRTGRAGRAGEAVTYYTEGDVGYVKGIARVIAAAQKEGAEGRGVGKWLLDVLPKTGRREKKEMVRRGVEGRRGGEGRISTKSGYDRQKRDRRRGAVEASKRRKVEEKEEGEGEDDDGEVFMGIDE